MEYKKIYIIQEKWQKYPYVWINKKTYKYKKNAFNKINKLKKDNLKGIYRIVERMMICNV